MSNLGKTVAPTSTPLWHSWNVKDAPSPSAPMMRLVKSTATAKPTTFLRTSAPSGVHPVECKIAIPSFQIMSGPRPQRSSYHQKALQQIRNSLQPFAAPDFGYSSPSSSGTSIPSSPNRQSPSNQIHTTSTRGIEYRAQQYPFVPSQVPASVQQLLRRIDSPSSPSSSSSNSPTSQLQTAIKKPTLVIKSTVVPKPVLQTAMPYSLPPPPPYLNDPPPLPPKPAKKSEPPLPPFKNGVTEFGKERGDFDTKPILPFNKEPPIKYAMSIGDRSSYGDLKISSSTSEQSEYDNNNSTNDCRNLNLKPHIDFAFENGHTNRDDPLGTHNGLYTPSSESSDRLTYDATASETNDSIGKPEQPPEEIHTHESPIPERKIWSREKEEERFESKVRVYSPQAFKFFMEQHVENVIKSHHERLHRRMQLESEMTKIGLSEEAQTQMRRMLSQKESNYIRLKRAKMDKSLFKQIRIIGVGAFGEVALVRKVDTQHLYAMKTLRKSDVLRRNQVAHVKAERDILAEADNEWVVKLYYSFQDMDHLYFVMDYIPGGDLMSLLIKKGIFEERLSQFYIAELTCAVESVHKMGFIHRDIKPDNILIDRDGHIKLTDFGLCTGFRWTHNSKYYQDTSAFNCCDAINKWQICECEDKGKPLDRRRKTNLRCLAHSLVGTPNYIAPEVLMRTGYTQLCDWWSVGVILYEMLIGQPPFLAPTPAETQHKVINWVSSLRIPSQASLSNNAKDLILKLCTDHSKRLGKGGATQVKSHPFFTSIDFESGLRRTTAPFIPKINHPTDTSNFDPCDGDKPDDTDDKPFDSNQFHGFFEFTFRRFFDDAYNENEEGGPVYV